VILVVREERERGFDSEMARRASIKLGDGDIRGQ